jgi:magnesium-transporting ATPase (P-type)
MILYFAYKSVLFTIPRFLFSFKDAFSGQPIYDDYYIALYNVVFTALPLLVRALFEQDVNYVTKIPESELGSSRDSEAISESQHLPIGYKINLGIRKLFPKIYFVGLKNQIFNLK